MVYAQPRIHPGERDAQISLEEFENRRTIRDYPNYCIETLIETLEKKSQLTLMWKALKRVK